MYHPQVVQSTIVNDCMKVKIDGNTEPQLVPNLLLQVSVRELNNNLFSDTDSGGLKEARYEENNIVISDYKLCLLLPPQLKKCRQDKSSCVVANIAYLPKVYIYNYCHGKIVILKTQGSQPKFSKNKVWGKRISNI